MNKQFISLLFTAVALTAVAETAPVKRPADVTPSAGVPDQTPTPVAVAIPASTKADVVVQPTGRTSGFRLNGGGDLRFRYDYKDNAPSTGGKIATAYQDYYRLRSRVWGEAGYENVTLFGRLANEFRGYHNAPHQSAFPDELFIDGLYLDVSKLFNKVVDVRAGRQDLKYGDGRIISDGSAGDGSRSTYFDAIRTTFHLTDKSSLDAFGIYQRPEDDWTLGNEHYDLTSRTGGSNNDQTESALGLYLTIREFKKFPFEVYYIWKNESRYFNKGNQTLRVPGRDYHTVGTRLTPTISERLSAEFEGAAQFGQTDDGRDILAFLGYAGLTYKIAPSLSWKPTIKGAMLYLSGDENANTGDDTNWNSPFNRTIWFSELGSGQYSKLAWNNLLYPHAEAGVSPFTGHKVSIEAGPMFAVANDTVQNDSYRGLLGILKYQFPLFKGFFRKESELKGAVLGEVFDAGDYYAKAETGYYLRFELSAKF